MNSSGSLKHFIFAFVIALVLYFITFHFIENRRTRKGPWQITFTTQSGTPALIVNEPQMNITNLTISFPGETAPATNVTLVFALPKPVPFDVPFGKCVFEDTTFQPGTIVFEKMFGHQIQLLPRALTIDRQDHPWQSNQTISVNKAGISPGAP